MPRRCLFVIHYPVFGGPHNQALRLTPALRSLGWETIVLIPGEPGNAAERLRAAGIQTLEAPLGRLRASADPRRHLRFVGGFRREVGLIRSLIRELRIDLVLLGGLVNPHGAIAGRLEGVPVVWQILDTLPPRVLRHALMPLVTRLAGAVMCTGEAVARAHPGAAGLGERLVLFFPPVDIELFRPDPAVRSRARSELGLGPDEPVVGTVGNLTPMKDHATLVRAAGVLHRMHPHTRFVILGSSYEHRSGYADEVLRTGEELGLQPHRDLILRDPGERVAELAQAFDVFWLSSRSRSEGLPTVLGEAMALGLPVVATRVGSVPEAVGGGGLLVPPSDPGGLARAAAQLIGDPPARAAMGEEGRRWASERFSVEASAAAHIRAFEIACGRVSHGAVA